VSQSRAPTPFSCASILTMHDAVELFLQLASEHLNAGGNQPSFMEYWDLLAKKLTPHDIEQKESMRRLNKARVAMKHHGTFPSELDLESFRASTTSFFKDNSKLVFGISFDEVSLIEFVKPETAREKLREAQQEIEQGDTLNALDKIAIAFAEMIFDYEHRKIDRNLNSPFFFGRNMTFLTSFHMGLSFHSSFPREFEKFVDSVKESIEAIQDAIKILALGIDFRKYSRFKLLTPHLTRMMSGDWEIYKRFGDQDKPLQEDAQFCVNFVIESALALAEFDYTLNFER
jgi:hypothetical protein